MSITPTTPIIAITAKLAAHTRRISNLLVDLFRR
jgi:hypothetical protein